MELQGRNLSVNMRPSYGDDVALLHHELGELIEAGVLDAQIEPREISRKSFGPTTEQAVVKFQRQHGLRATAEVDERTARAINAMVDGLQSKPLSISGNIFTKENLPASGLRVIAIDKSVGGDLSLGEAITDGAGRYNIPYTKESIQNLGKQKADIEIKVIDSEDESIIYGTSSVLYNAGKDENINIILKTKRVHKTSEYNRIASGLRPHIRDGSFKDLQENTDRQDISYLANKTGWDARLVAMVSLADKYSSETGIPAQYYFALLRANIGTDSDNLYETGAETVKKVWEKAVEENIIDGSLKRRIGQNLSKFKEKSKDHILEKAKPVGVSSFKDMAGLTLDDISDQRQFAEMYYNHQGEIAEFWTQAGSVFGKARTEELRLNGKLGYLTINNKGLITKLRQENHLQKDPIDLIRNGFYRSERWETILDNGIRVPEEIPGKDESEKKKNYINYMIHHLKAGYPTAVVAEQVKNGELPIKGGNNVKDAVYSFFNSNQDKFEIGRHPVEKFLADNDINLEANTKEEIKRIQRLYQISPGDKAMTGLAVKGFDSAYSITQFGEQEFIENFKEDLGGKKVAKLTYLKANQVRCTAMNLATSFLTTRMSPGIYVISGKIDVDVNNNDIIAYPTLEELFGEMDYCSCEHCRSVLSPAAYLVDLLEFINLKKTDKDGKELPKTYEKQNPLDVLLKRRPDIEHIQLTCENTNTVLPYIDLVNEILEYYVVNGYSINDFRGHNIENDITTEELLANPQFVEDAAYTILKEDAVYPFNLPFNRPLETLREYFEHLKIPLYEAMEKFRVNDDLDINFTVPNPAPYGWRDIYNEYLCISPQEYKIFTDSNTKKIPEYFGIAGNTSFTIFDDKMANAKTFARTAGVTYKELVDILKTRFINPNNHLIPKLERLGVRFDQIRGFYEGIISDEDFETLLPDDLDVSFYGGDVKQWVKDNYTDIERIILLIPKEGNEQEECDFGSLEMKYASPVNGLNRLKAIEYWKLLRFIRLWKKLGWSIEETDKTIAALYKADYEFVDGDTENIMRAKLDNGFKDLLIKLSHVKKIKTALNVNRKGSLLKLLTLWSTIDTNGDHSLYRQMFLPSSLSQINDKFKEDGYGNYLIDENEKLIDHKTILQAAFNLTEQAFSLVLNEAGFNSDSPLSMDNVSHIYRHAFLARALRLSMDEFIVLKKMSGVHPFQELEDVNPGILFFIQVAQLIKESDFKVQELKYLFNHEDETGKGSPKQDDILSIAKTLGDELVNIEHEYIVEDDPTGEIAQSKMAFVYGNDVSDRFFGLLSGASFYSTDYSHHQPELESVISDTNKNLAYDDFNKQLSFRGVMAEEEKDTLVNVPGVSNDFINAVQALFDLAQEDYKDFFEKYPELKPIYEDFVVSDKSIKIVLEAFLPTFKEQAKRLAVKQTLTALLGVDQPLLNKLIEGQLADGENYIIHAEGLENEPSILDFLNISKRGVSAQYYFSDNVSKNADLEDAVISNIAFTGNDNNELSKNPDNEDAPISARWLFYLNVPANENYNFYMETDIGANVRLRINREEKTMLDSKGDGLWQNQEAISLSAGKLYPVEIIISKVKNKAILKWKSKGTGKDTIPSQYLYPFNMVRNFNATYLRVLKAILLIEKLGLSDKSVQFISDYNDFKFNNSDGNQKIAVLNKLPINPNPAIVTVRALFARFIKLQKLNELKASLKSDTDELISVLQNPGVSNEAGDSLLLKLTGWNESMKQVLLQRFSLAEADLSDWEEFLRVQNAFNIVHTMGIFAPDLMRWVTNDPDATIIQNIQNTLRSKYDESVWLDALQPINDRLRNLQRDALVSYVLHKMQQNTETEHINTPDKLFEFFLIDVEMEPCMKTSRIKQALSTVQLFIQRCLMNLETNVSSSSIKVKQWEWMKRYRVWEANRKVFLYPENWLEPELRDNKSSFFKDFESELLQADITDDMAHAALLHYLEKVDEVAKLEISGMYLQENETGNVFDDILHVFGRTPGMNRKYFYRRFEYGYWTPWENVDLDIEDNPILPVVWNSRLFLFWLNIIQKGESEGGSPPPDTSLGELSGPALSQLTGEAKVTVEVNLSWSEYYNNKWQPQMTSDFDAPIKIVKDIAPEQFNRKTIQLQSKSTGGELIISIYYYELVVEWKVKTVSKMISVVDKKYLKYGYFKFFNKYSVPINSDHRDNILEIDTDSTNQLELAVAPKTRDINLGGELYIDYYSGGFKLVTDNPDFSHEVLKEQKIFSIVSPEHRTDNIYEAPFFYQDRQHVFFVQPDEGKVPLKKFDHFGLYFSRQVEAAPTFSEVQIRPDEGAIGLARKIEARKRSGSPITKVISTKGQLNFGDTVIGHSGSKFSKL